MDESGMDEGDLRRTEDLAQRIADLLGPELRRPPLCRENLEVTLAALAGVAGALLAGSGAGERQLFDRVLDRTIVATAADQAGGHA